MLPHVFLYSGHARLWRLRLYLPFVEEVLETDAQILILDQGCSGSLLKFYIKKEKNTSFSSEHLIYCFVFVLCYVFVLHLFNLIKLFSSGLSSQMKVGSKGKPGTC